MVVLFGPAVTAFAAAIVLLYQALLLAHGGMIPSRRDAVTALAVVAGFECSVGDERFAEQSNIEVPYVDRISAFRGCSWPGRRAGGDA